MNIAAILPGQKPDSKFNIPERRPSDLSRHDSRPETHPHQSSASADVTTNVTTNNNLIDLSEVDEPAPGAGAAAAPIQSRIAADGKVAPALTQDPPGFERPHLLKDMTNQELQANATGTGGAGTADLNELRDGVGNLKVASEGVRGLSAATGEPKHHHGLRRMDSETQEEDEFVDAES